MNSTKYHRNNSAGSMARRMAKAAGAARRENVKLRRANVSLQKTADGYLAINRSAAQEFMEMFAAQDAVIASLRWQLDLANGDRFEARMLAEGKGE